MSLSPTEVSEEEFTIFENEHHSSEWRGGQWLPLPRLWDFLVALGQTELGVPTVGMLDSTKTYFVSTSWFGDQKVQMESCGASRTRQPRLPPPDPQH